MKNHSNSLRFKRLGIDTLHEHIAYMREDCQVCTSEGFEAMARVTVSANGRSVVTNIHVLKNSQLLKQGEIGLSESAVRALDIVDGKKVTVSHLSPIDSLSHVRSKIYGNKLDQKAMNAIIHDIVEGNYANVHLAAFITACAGDNLDKDEIISLTKAMLNSGKQMKWDYDLVMDKHCIGGLPGNRTSPIIVAILSEAGLIIPKTSSRAITSPAGTADMMDVMAPVNLSIKQIRKVVDQEGGCLVWGRTAKLSPSDDILILVEKALDIDSDGQLIASVLSKKAASGSTHVVIDIPVGKTAKVRTEDSAEKLKYLFKVVAKAIGLKIRVIFTDGTQPVGRGIGPALEAMDVLSVLRNENKAPQDLKERALTLAGNLLEMAGKARIGKGVKMAAKILESGKAYKKFMAICLAQGGFVEPEFAIYKEEIKAKKAGTVIEINNRNLARVAKLAGAPQDVSAGIVFEAPIGTEVAIGQTLFTVYAHSKGELNYALDYLKATNGDNIIRITG